VARTASCTAPLGNLARNPTPLATFSRSRRSGSRVQARPTSAASGWAGAGARANSAYGDAFLNSPASRSLIPARSQGNCRPARRKMRDR
jgi:hypothetical protein